MFPPKTQKIPSVELIVVERIRFRNPPPKKASAKADVQSLPMSLCSRMIGYFHPSSCKEQIRALRTLFETREAAETSITQRYPSYREPAHIKCLTVILMRRLQKEHLRLLAERVERSDWDVKLEHIRQA